MSDCNHKWSEAAHEGVLSRCCHVCNEWEVEAELTRLRAENDRLKASRLPDVEYARLDTMWQQLVRERDEFKARLAHAEADAEQAVHNEAFVERQRIAAWLRKVSERYSLDGALSTIEFARSIEAGEHLEDGMIHERRP